MKVDILVKPKPQQPVKFESSYPKGSDPYKIEKRDYLDLQKLIKIRKQVEVKK